MYLSSIFDPKMRWQDLEILRTLSSCAFYTTSVTSKTRHRRWHTAHLPSITTRCCLARLEAINPFISFPRFYLHIQAVQPQKIAHPILPRSPTRFNPIQFFIIFPFLSWISPLLPSFPPKKTWSSLPRCHHHAQPRACSASRRKDPLSSSRRRSKSLCTACSSTCRSWRSSWVEKTGKDRETWV